MAQLPLDAEILPPSDDHIFKTLLTRPDAKTVLMDVVSVSIERTVVDVAVRNTELPISDVNEKTERFDVNCTVDGGDQVDVEMHSSRIEERADGHKNFINKYVYYATDLHSSQQSKGVEYDKLVRTYQVTFCGYTVLPDRRDFVNRASLRFQDGGQLSDQLNMVIVELSKLNSILKKSVKKLTPLEMWSLFFRYASDPKHRDLVNSVIRAKEEIDMASKLLMEISKDEQERARFRSKRMFETDMISNLIVAEKRGEKKGEAKGEVKEKERTVRAMRNENMDINTIAKITKLSIDDISKIL